MAEPEGTAEIDATGEVKVPIDLEASAPAEEARGTGPADLDSVAGLDGVDPVDEGGAEGVLEGPVAPEPPRRRLVAELLEGQEGLSESSRRDLQLVAPPLHLETLDAGQPIYRLDLSSDEPQCEIVEPDPMRAAPADIGYGGDATYAAAAVAGDARAAVKRMVMQRDRQVMAAERDGLGAYALAVGLDEFVEAILAAARRD